MNILFYAKNRSGEVIQQLIERASPAVEVFRTLEDLTTRLHSPLDDPTVAVLVAHTREGLEELLVIRNLFSRVWIILILPDREPETVAMGHALRARFLTYLDGDPLEVGLVLGRMWERAEVCGHR